MEKRWENVCSKMLPIMAVVFGMVSCHIYIYMVPPPKKKSTTFTTKLVFAVFCSIFGT